MDDPLFLTVQEILKIHCNQIELYGGSAGLKDASLLDSAVAMPKATYNGEYLHPDIYKMAAAYTYHLCLNHPFVDGNKRTALVAGLLFLDFNGIDIEDPDGVLYEAMIKIASNEKDKDYLANLFEQLHVNV